MGYLGATLTQVFTRACTGETDTSLRDVTIARDGKRGKQMRMMSWFWDVRILGIWRKLVEMWSASGEDGWLSLARKALWWVPHKMGGRWKNQNRKIVPLSPYVEEPLDSKVIKGFIPERRSRKCFSCFEIPMFYVIYIWTLYVHFTYPYQDMVQ